MKTSHKIAALGSLTAVAGAAACWTWMIRMTLKEFTRYALYMAALDDEICRNELEGKSSRFRPRQKPCRSDISSSCK